MSDSHFKFWPDHALHHLDLPATNVFYNLEVSARRHPHKPCLVFYDTSITFAEVFDEAQRIAGFCSSAAESAKATACFCTCRTARNS